MRPYCLTLVILIAVVLAEPYGKGGGRGGGGRGRGGSSSHHSYPSSTGYSGNSAGSSHTYPQSTGLSGSGHGQKTTYQQNQQHRTNTYNSAKTEVHHHYHYSPPQQISYGSTYHPIYRAPPPVYVYEYRDSGSRFDTLLTGLALYNLGRMSERHSHYDVNREYRNSPGEICKLGISRQNGEYEETRIDCRLMTSFIWESGSQRPSTNQNVISTNKTTTTVVEITTNSNNTLNGVGNNSKVTTTVTEEKTVNALQVKGPSISVTPDMKCFMIHISRDSAMSKKNVDCALLQMYAQKSLYRSSSSCVFPKFLVLISLVYILLL